MKNNKILLAKRTGSL